ncbi:hypothetical protein P3T36_005668 [Kitasatospora sp. MAP12-15]|uniref:hypothetical protein n=1 Tax=unclassified Kitasatospora TaxID=2633591 RepID=UPI002476D262|nr:hypothetical protein [Kitasatospora sp. MAP12-44]MDH6113820.1 hypothetical protein [Kitasatospora sp. MAP12-44]
MTVLNRLLGTALATGALLLAGGVLPTAAQAATPQQADYGGYATATSPGGAEQAAYSHAYSAAAAAGFAQSQCLPLGLPSVDVINELAVRPQMLPWPTVWEADVQVQCASAPVAGSVNLNRYNGPEHLTTTGTAPAGYYLEGSLGFVYTGQAAGTAPLYACEVGTDTFSSRAADCEGQRYLGLLGYVYTAPPAGVATRPLMRCRAADHFDSNDVNCEGQIIDGLLGYTLA